MQTQSLEFGVYAIVYTKSRKFYIGSTSQTFKQRCAEHRSCLGRQTHRNRALQNIWNKHGGEHLRFEILEVVKEKEEVIEAEQRWIDTFRVMGKCLFNGVFVAGSQLGYRHREETKQTIREKVLISKTNPETIQRHSAGSKRAWESEERRERTKQSFRAFNNSKEKREQAGGRYAHTFSFCAPDGTEHLDIVNLSEFCRQQGLNISAMGKLHKGRKQTYKGWTRIGWEGYTKGTFDFVSPDGEVFAQISDLFKFCEHHDLIVPEMWKLGYRQIPEHRGWTRPPKKRR